MTYVERALEAAFAAAAMVRKAPVLHPIGLTFRSRAVFVDVLAEAMSADVSNDHFVRFSRGAGLPASMPDILGLALKLRDAHGAGRDQDLLLSTSVVPRAPRFTLPVLAADFTSATYSSILPYGIGSSKVMVYAQPMSNGPARTLEDLVRGVALRPLTVPIFVVDETARTRKAGEVTVNGLVPEEEGADLRFDPWNTGALRPLGFINRMRAPAYRGSRSGARRVRTGRAGGASKVENDADESRRQ